MRYEGYLISSSSAGRLPSVGLITPLKGALTQVKASFRLYLSLRALQTVHTVRVVIWLSVFRMTPGACFHPSPALPFLPWHLGTLALPSSVLPAPTGREEQRPAELPPGGTVLWPPLAGDSEARSQGTRPVQSQRRMCLLPPWPLSSRPPSAPIVPFVSKSPGCSLWETLSHSLILTWPNLSPGQRKGQLWAAQPKNGRRLT